MKKNYEPERLKEYERKILDYFVSICNKNKITYYLVFGTLLGAVRHGDFIPWDDDIDVALKPEDYYKFKKIMLNNNNNKDFFYQSLETDKYYSLTFAKIRMNNTKAIEKKTEKEETHQGIYIDIFPLIPLPIEKKDKKKFMYNKKIIKLLIESDLKDKTKYTKYGKIGKILANIFKIIPRNLRNKIAIKKLEKMIMYSGKYEKYTSIADDETFSAEVYKEVTKVKFGKKQYNSPKDFDKNLKEIYGDYMKLPPKDKRKGHSFVEVDFGDDKDE